MVILQFNKLIRNKWIWGAFAIAISAFFAFDFLLDDLRSPVDSETLEGDAGKLAGKPIDAALFQTIAEDVRGFGRQRDDKTDQSEINLTAWENYAALKVADETGIEATDAEVRAMIRRDPSFQQNGGFSFKLYQRLLRENGLSDAKFEASLKRSLTLRRLSMAVLGSAAWSSPMEVEQAVADMTDTFTVKVAHFTQDKKDADAVKLDDAGLKKWYDENVKSLTLPERTKIRYVKFDARDPKILAKMVVTEDAMHDYYDQVSDDQFKTTDTNGVETVKKFEDVKDVVEKKLREIAAVEYFETNLNQRAYGVASDSKVSRLDEIAEADGLKVEESDWFALEGGYQEGFMKRASTILPGAANFNEAVAELDMESADLRYAVISSDRAVWLVEKKEVSPAHTPTFDEAKEAVRPRALRAAKADAFKAAVESVTKKGVAAVEAVKGISSNIVFSVSNIQSVDIADKMAVARAAMQLKKGEVSEFTSTGTGRGLVVVCVDRKAGDAAEAMVRRSQIRNELASLQQGQIPEAWRKWNLGRLGFEPGALSTITKAEDAE